MDPSSLTPALICPACRGPLVKLACHRLRCPSDSIEYTCDDGIWRFLPSQRAADVEGFVDDYRRLRHDEGWGADDRAYYRALPFHDTTGRHTEIWRIRAASYALLHQQVTLQTDERRRIIDLGAGNCWLSWRLAAEGHAVTALDLSDDPADGLGAGTAYPETRFLRVQAAFDQVPFDDGQFDLAIFNGSLHYATDVRGTLAEAKRLLRPGGRIVIMDSPVYRHVKSGKRMLQERQKDWTERYGSEFGTFPTEGFLTRQRLRHLGQAQGLDWRMHPLPLGWRWHLAPLAAIAVGRREPARFPLIVSRPID